jgi:hypothetical protein
MEKSPKNYNATAIFLPLEIFNRGSMPIFKKILEGSIYVGG